MKQSHFLTNTISMLSLTVFTATLAFSQISYAQDTSSQNTTSGAPSGNGAWHHWHHPHQSLDQRLANLKAALQIQSNQQGAWQAYASALQTAHTDRKTAWQQYQQTAQSLTFPQRIDKRATISQQMQTDRQAVDSALKQLYGSLTQQQQGVLEQHFSHQHKNHTANG